MSLSLRPVAPGDLDLVCRHREEMFRSAGDGEDVLESMAGPYRDWQEKSLGDGSYYGFIAEQEGQAVGGIGLMEIAWPPHPLHPDQARRGYVLNLFVEPDRRGQGIAKRLMAEAEAEFSRRGLAFAILHATQKTRPLYERDGWVQTSEMAKRLPVLS
ncbi:GNAT family N-acetyltransferase [Labrenzia sp. VG12]|uniref:GNAT family N-acetyltransferase n=1 Tax=Labrenzia sp. VG12 TaxID=2021862 RepID=UPI000B8BFAA8|nr:GNAT family N-acetyltransferase [Labrenzia sp. VG12]ASP31838.1 GNAT family N-acetyltransferase [Labrenzia sp. VG12]